MVKALRLAALAALAVAIALVATWAVRGLNGDTGALSVTGTVEATQVDLSAKITGRVVELLVREGQPVERGQLLARLDDTELAAEVRRAEAALATAEAQLRDLLAGPRQQEIEQARAALRNATVTREWTERELRRVRELFGKDLVAAQEVDRAQQAYEVAVANEVAARERLALVEAGPRPHEVEAARARVAEARAALTLAQARLAEARLVSPITGLVLRKNVEVGETVNPGVSILTLMDPRDLWVRAYVPEIDIGRVKLGQEARITVDAYPGRAFAGTVSEIASEAEFTPKNVQTRKERVNLVFRIKIAVRNPDGVLKPGMPADAEIHP
ncbi:MAG TPA: efflux RND transporter periplasmic adaptor subunit [Methylomirabilota bacterium]|jgi:HlyD family secretion protein|nr:efflux RND transporter periplasmic adaptor subunit [Methylomirabilota bacterium]